MPSVQNFQKSCINHQEYSLNQKEKANFRKTVSFGSKKDSVELSSNKNICTLTMILRKNDRAN